MASNRDIQKRSRSTSGTRRPTKGGRISPQSSPLAEGSARNVDLRASSEVQAAHIQKFTEIRPLYDSFSDRIQQLLVSLMDVSSIKYQVVESRTKTIESFAEKISRVGKSYNDPIAELPDLCGCRIITYYADDVGKVSDTIRSEFKVVEEEMSHRPDELDDDRFGYLSVHYVVKLNVKRSRLAEWKQYKNCRAEIQIRTVIQHAWSAVSHLLQYKQEASIPSRLRRRLFRIASLFELADEEFVGIRDQRTVLEKKTAEQLATGNKSIPLTSTGIQQMLSGWDLLKPAREAAKKAGYALQDYLPEVSCIPEIYEVAVNAGIRTLDQLEQSVRRDDITIFEELLSDREENTTYGATDDYLFFLLLLARYPDKYSAEQLVSHQWGREWAEKIMNLVRSGR